MFGSPIRCLLTGLLLGAIDGCGDPPTGGPMPNVATPPPSAGHALVFHDSLGAVLLINAGLGGMTSPPIARPTTIWRWSGQRWTAIDSSGPSVRNLGGVAYDSHRNAVVVFGGTYDETHSYDDTWEWRPDAGWHRIDVPGPGRRDHTQMAYDPNLRLTILFGGQIGVDNFSPDTWSWDGTGWQRIATAGPPPRVHHSMAFDQATGRIVVFGGVAAGHADLGDSWAWSGTQWVPAAAASAPRTHATIGAIERGLILVGGLPSSGVLRLEGGNWAADPAQNPPGPRYLSAMAYDRIRKVTVLFGGGNPAGNDLLADTWEFNGSRWTSFP